VAKGFTQTFVWHRLSRDVCSCGQTSLNSILFILSVAAKRSWLLHQLDVKKKGLSSWRPPRIGLYESPTGFSSSGVGRESLKVKKGDIWSQAVSSGLVRDMKFGYDEDRWVSREGMLIIPCS